MSFEPWNPEADRWGLFYYERQLYAVPVHPFASIMDGHRALEIHWRPRARGVPGFIPRTAQAAPIAGPFKSQAEALAEANQARMQARFRARSGEA